MQRGSHALSSPPHQYNSVHTTEAVLPVRGSELLPDERVPGVVFAGPSTVNRPGFPTPSQYTTRSNEGYEPSSQISPFGEQPLYAYQGNQSDAHHVSEPAQHNLDPSIAPGLLQPEYYTLPDYPQQIPNDVTIGRAPQLPNVVIPFQGLPGPIPPGMSTEDELRQLANRYFHDPDSRINKVRVRHSRRSGKVKVMVLLELDQVE